MNSRNLKVWWIGVVALVVITASYYPALAHVLSQGASVGPLMVTVQQSVPVVADVTVFHNGEEIVTSIPITVDVALAVSISGDLTTNAQVVGQTKPEILVEKLTPLSKGEAIPPIPDSMILLRSDFKNSDVPWESESVNWTEEKAEIDDGRLILSEDEGNDVHPSWASPNIEIDDFVVEVDARRISGALAGKYGVGFRFTGNRERVQKNWWESTSYYAFIIGNDGQWEVTKNTPKNYVILEDGFSESIDRSGQDNRIRVEAVGEQMHFFVNGDLIAEITDSELADGDIMLLSASPNTDLGFASSFDNFVLARVSQE